MIWRQDLLDLYTIRDIKAIETLVLLLKERVGGSVVYANLARDLQCDATTIKSWLEILENLYVCYRVTPYHKKITRSLLKEPKFYFCDNVYAHGDTGARLENIVANVLLKELHYLRDTRGADVDVHYLRTKEGKELDFAVCIDGDITHLIEVKVSDDEPAPGFKYFSQYFPDAQKIQLVKNLKREATYPNGLEVRNLVCWLSEFTLLSVQV